MGTAERALGNGGHLGAGVPVSGPGQERRRSGAEEGLFFFNRQRPAGPPGRTQRADLSGPADGLEVDVLELSTPRVAVAASDETKEGSSSWWTRGRRIVLPRATR